MVHGTSPDSKPPLDISVNLGAMVVVVDVEEAVVEGDDVLVSVVVLVLVLESQAVGVIAMTVRFSSMKRGLR